MIWKLNDIDFADYGVIVSKSSGVLDLPNIVDVSNDWIDLNGKEYWQDQEDVKYQDREIVLQCWILATGYEDFKTKVDAFFAAFVSLYSIPVLKTPFEWEVNVSLFDSVPTVRKTQYNQTIQAGQFSLRLTVLGDIQSKIIIVYKVNGDVRAYTYYGSDAKVSKTLQGISEISFTTEFPTIQAFDQDDYILLDGEKYISLEFPQVDKFSTNKYVYRLSFVNQFFVLKDIQFRVTDSSDFYWWANLDNIIDKIIENANRGYNGLFLKGTIDATEYRNHQFQNENCYDVVSRIAGVYELEFEYLWNSLLSKIQINVKASVGDNTGLSIEYGKGNGLYKINRVSTGRDLMVTNLFAYGSEKNIPAGYGFTRLKLSTEPVVGYYLGKHIEKTKVWEDIFPHRTGIVTSYTYVAPVQADLPETAEYQLFDDSMFDLNAVSVSGGSTIYLNGSTPAKIHFNSGNMAGFEFEVRKFVFDDISGIGGTFYLIPVKEVPDIMYPNTDIHPGASDEYVLLDINLPQSYIDAAETELQTAADDYVTEFKTPKPTYTVETDPAFTFGSLLPGDTMNMIDADFGMPTGTAVRITDILTNLYQGGSTIILASFVSKSRIKKLTERVNAIERSIVNVKLNEVPVIKGSQQTTADLKNEFIDPLDNLIIPDKIRKKIIPLEGPTDSPVILDYNSKYGETIGQNPTVRLIEIDGLGNRIERTEKPYTIIDNETELIESINFGTLDSAINGHIILQ